jgi:hypothetical protein
MVALEVAADSLKTVKNKETLNSNFADKLTHLKGQAHYPGSRTQCRKYQERPHPGSQGEVPAFKVRV